MNAYNLFSRALKRAKNDKDIYYSFIQVSREEYSVIDEANALDDAMRRMFQGFAHKLMGGTVVLSCEDEVVILDLLVSELKNNPKDIEGKLGLFGLGQAFPIHRRKRARV